MECPSSPGNKERPWCGITHALIPWLGATPTSLLKRLEDQQTKQRKTNWPNMTTIHCLISVPTLINVPPARFCKKICVPIPNKRTPCTKPKKCQKSYPPCPINVPPSITKMPIYFEHLLMPKHINTTQITQFSAKFNWIQKYLVLQAKLFTEWWQFVLKTRPKNRTYP